MKLIKSHSILSALVSINVLLSMTASLCSMEMVDVICDSMEMGVIESPMDSHSMDHMNHQMGDMPSHNKSDSSQKHCDMTIDCECELESNKQAVVSAKSLTKVLPTRFLISYQNMENFESSALNKRNNFTLEDSYSPPPLFLANETFLI